MFQCYTLHQRFLLAQSIAVQVNLPYCQEFCIPKCVKYTLKHDHERDKYGPHFYIHV